MKATADEELLSEEELTFLLDDYKTPAGEPADSRFADPEAEVAVIVGDLSRMPLREFLLERQHTECVLSVSNP